METWRRLIYNTFAKSIEHVLSQIVTPRSVKNKSIYTFIDEFFSADTR